MKDNKNATFIQRLGALVIDLLMLLCISSIITTVTVDMDNYQKLSKELTSVENQYKKGKIAPMTYISKAIDINYDISRETGLSTIIMVAVYILYFIIFQFKKNGQTLGKKIMKIRVVSNDDKDLNINQIAVRSLIINCILADLLVLTVSILGSKNVYMVGIFTVEFIQYILLFVIAIMVLSRKDKRGLHDVITNTKVIKEV